jgi:hypothetical protein
MNCFAEYSLLLLFLDDSLPSLLTAAMIAVLLFWIVNILSLLSLSIAVVVVAVK